MFKIVRKNKIAEKKEIRKKIKLEKTHDELVLDLEDMQKEGRIKSLKYGNVSDLIKKPIHELTEQEKSIIKLAGF